MERVQSLASDTDVGRTLRAGFMHWTLEWCDDGDLRPGDANADGCSTQVSDRRAIPVCAVGWYLGSYLVITYSLVGAVIWHVAVRPIEERDLTDRFADDYERYRQQVGLWWPRFRNAIRVENSN